MTASTTEVLAAAARAGYRVFTDVDKFKRYAEALLGVSAPQRELVS